MVLFDEDPVTLITETTNQFHIAPDKDALSRISSSLSALAFNRASRVEAQHATIKKLSRKLNTLKSQNEYEQAKRDTGRHASDILALDGEKFRIAKTVSEIEIESESLSGELASLHRSIEEMKRNGVDQTIDKGETTVLQLQFYRSLGIELAAEKAVVRDGANMTVIDLLEDKSLTSQVWEALLQQG